MAIAGILGIGLWLVGIVGIGLGLVGIVSIVGIVGRPGVVSQEALCCDPRLALTHTCVSWTA